MSKTNEKLIDLFAKIERLEKNITEENCMHSLQEYDYLMSVIHNLLNVRRYEFAELIDIAATAHFEELKKQQKKDN